MKKVVVKKKPVAKKKMIVKKKKAPSPLTPVQNARFFLRCYHGTAPPWYFKKDLKDWETGRWYVISRKSDEFAKGTERTGYATQEDARKALQAL